MSWETRCLVTLVCVDIDTPRNHEHTSSEKSGQGWLGLSADRALPVIQPMSNVTYTI